MPSPFPGMDPYLEAPALWPDVHHALIGNMRELLLPQLRPAYFAQIEERVYVTEEFEERRRVIVPDVSVVEVDPFATSTSGGTAVATAPFPAVTVTEIEVHEAHIEVRDASSREIVAVIEVLSPANKVRGSTGFDSYDRKRAEVLHSRANFVEVDLLREGFRYPISGRVPPGEYRIHVSKGHERPKGWVWPIRVIERLPTIRIPLRRGEAEIELDLQKLLDITYERAGYDLILDYTKPPAVPLPESLQAWAEPILATTPAVSR